MKSLFMQESAAKGQGLVEYALILVLVAIVVIAALMILGPLIGNVFSEINSSLGSFGGGSAIGGGGGSGGSGLLPAGASCQTPNQCASHKCLGTPGNRTCQP